MKIPADSLVVLNKKTRSNPAFTLIELLAVMTVISILAAMFFSGFGKVKAAGQSIACVNNVRQLQLAWLMYSDEHTDTLPPNEDNFTRGLWRSLPGSWVIGNAQEDESSTNIESGVIFPYSRSLPIYHCPADKSTFSGNARLLRHRSYMLSIYMNSVPFDSRVKNKSTQIPDPASAFVFLDASGWTINDGVFNINYTDIPANWYDDPSDRHGKGCNLSFVDGHIGHLRWRWPKTARNYSTLVVNEDDLQDLRKLQRFIPEP